MRNLKIGIRLTIGFLVLILLMLLVGGIGVKNIKQIDAQDTFLFEKATVPIADLNVMNGNFQRIRANLYRAVIAHQRADITEIEAALKLCYKLSSEMDSAAIHYKSTLLNAEDSALYDQYLTLAKKFELEIKTVDGLLHQKDANTELISYLKSEKFNSLIDEINPLLAKITMLNVKAAAEISDNNTKTADRAVLIMIISILVSAVIALFLGIWQTRLITRPINNCVEIANKVADGETSVEIIINSKDEVGTLLTSMKRMIAAISALTSDAQLLSTAAVAGKLSTRADASKHQGDFRKVVEGVNETLDSVIGPLNVAASYVDQISKGAIPAKITDNYNGDFNTIKNNLNTCIDAVNELVKDANMLSVAAVEGKLSTRADASKHQGDFRKIVQGVNDCLDSVIGPLNVAADYVDQISKGAIPPKITDNYNGDFNTIKNNLNTCIDAVNNLVKDANMLSIAAVEGRLSTRADASKHQGDFAKIVQGVNDCLDSVIQPIHVLQQHLERVSEGDLTAFIEQNYNGDHALLKNALNRTLESLNEILGQVASSSQQVQIGAGELSSASQTVSQGSTESAASIEEISSSMAELSAQTKQNAENASVANQLASSARSTAEVGNKQMDNMVDAMTEIEGASRDISKIIKVIDEIAFQTNLLALNAAVEAARAGVHGKGFAVVAEEVRNLAARSAKAAKETTEMIESTIYKVSNGSSIASETQRSLKEIVSAAARVSDLVSEINVASNEQSVGLQQVNQGISQLDAVTQQNSAASEEAAAGSEELNGQAEILIEAIGRFKLKGGLQIQSQRRSIAASPVRGITSSTKNQSRSTPKINSVTAHDLIDLDDPDFGKF